MEMDILYQKKIELMLDIATKKYDKEISTLKQEIETLKKFLSAANNEIGTLKNHNNIDIEQDIQNRPQSQQPKKKVEIVDLRPKEEQQEIDKSKNAEPLRPRYGDYKSEDVSIEKFFYFGRR